MESEYMNLDNFLNNVSIIREDVDIKDVESKDTEKLIKNIKKLRFNAMFKNLSRINQFMSNSGSSVRGVVKQTILNGALNLFKQSKERSHDFIKSKNDIINKNVENIVKKFKLEDSLASIIENVEFERMSFEKIMEQSSDLVLTSISNNDQLTFFMTQFLKKEMLNSTEEKKYYERSVEIIEYFVIQTMLLRSIFSCIQTTIARIVSKIKLSKVDDAERKAKQVGDILIKFFKNYVENKYGASIGKYLSTYVEDYYHSTDDKKEQFTKFENIINIILGIKQA